MILSIITAGGINDYIHLCGATTLRRGGSDRAGPRLVRGFLSSRLELGLAMNVLNNRGTLIPWFEEGGAVSSVMRCARLPCFIRSPNVCLFVVVSSWTGTSGGVANHASASLGFEMKS